MARSNKSIVLDHHSMNLPRDTLSLVIGIEPLAGNTLLPSLCTDVARVFLLVFRSRYRSEPMLLLDDKTDASPVPSKAL